MQFRVLGPVEVEAATGLVELGGPRQRAVLAVLLARYPKTVSTDALIDAVWSAGPPDSAGSTLRGYLSRLRRALEPDRDRRAPSTVIVSRGAGYALAVDDDVIDARRFERMAEAARQSREEGRPSEAAETYRAALELWRGDAYQDFAFEDFAQAEAGRLEELRLGCVEDLFDVELALGREREIIGDVEAHSTRHPLRERALGLRMLTLYRCGRQAEALRVYEDGRNRLIEELGLDPSPEVQRQYEAILRHEDPTRPRVARSGRPGPRTLTFLFGDVEGSTRQLRELGDDYLAELDRQRTIVERAAMSHGGHELRLWGDGCFVTFDSAGAAVATAVEAQVELARAGTRLPTRMGLHTGEAAIVDGDYVGLAVHVAARIHEAAHGGQILASHATHDLLVADEHDVDMVDLGPHVLKDVARPERLYQVVADGLRRDFPPLRVRSVRGDNLPTRQARFIGRRRELRSVGEALTRCRVVTLTGSGGCGKTRLATELGRTPTVPCRDGVWFCDIAATTTAEDLVGSIAAVIDVEPSAGRTLRETVLAALAQRELLLIVDNCENVIDEAASLIAEITSSCPDVVVLATSREPLRIAGEQVHRLEPLETSDQGGEAVELFEDRARAVRHDFALDDRSRPDVAAICERLDGIPLAIELAAARVASMSPAEIADRLSENLEFLHAATRDTPTRHRTLQATVDWSYALLDPEEQELFDGLGVFAGGFGLSALEAIGAVIDPEVDVLHVLTSLVEKSMVVAVLGERETSYSLLEPLRRFALERLEARGRTEAVRVAHADHVAGLVEAGRAEWGTAQEFVYIRRVLAERENIRAAALWAIENGHIDLAMQIVTGSRFLGWALGLVEQYDWMQRLASTPASRGHPVEPELIAELANERWSAGDLEAADALLDRAMALVDEEDGLRWAALLGQRSSILLLQGRLEECIVVAAECEGVARRHGRPLETGLGLFSQVLAHEYLGDRAASRACLDAVRELVAEHGSLVMRAGERYSTGEVLLDDDPDQALAALDECLDICREFGLKFHYGIALTSAATLRARRGDATEALQHLLEVVEYWRRNANWLQQWNTLRNVVELFARIGAAEEAAVLLAACEAATNAPPIFGQQAQRLAVLTSVLEERLGPDAWRAARERGRRLDGKGAVRHAVNAIGEALELVTQAG